MGGKTRSRQRASLFLNIPRPLFSVRRGGPLVGLSVSDEHYFGKGSCWHITETIPICHVFRVHVVMIMRSLLIHVL